MPPTQRRSTSSGPDRPTANGDARRRAVVRDRVENLARILQARIDDLDRGNDVFGGAQHLGQPHARSLQRLAHDEGKLDLHPRPAIIRMRDLGAVRDHHVVEQVPVVRLVDLRGALHGFRGQPNLVPDQLRPGRDLTLGHLGGDRIGVLDGDIRPGLRKLDRLFALLFRTHQNVGGFLAVGIGQHDVSFRRRIILDGGSLARNRPARSARSSRRTASNPCAPCAADTPHYPVHSSRRHGLCGLAIIL